MHLRSPSLAAPGLAMLVLWFGSSDGAAGARLILRGRPEVEKLESPGQWFSAVLQVSEEASTLLARADEAIKREDWKLAIDSLQRMIELPGEHVLTSDGQRYESARRHAHRRIASLPPPGLEAYRLVYDGEASALLARAEAHHDPSPLRTIVERLVMTTHGDDAAITLADWLLDEGGFSEAAALLRHVQSLYPDSDLPSWAIPGRLAVCAAAMGQRQRARTLLEALAATLPPKTSTGTRPTGAELTEPTCPLTLADRIQQIRAYISRTAADSDAGQVASWPMAFGGLSRQGKMPAVEPTVREELPWQVRLPVREPRPGFAAMRDYARRRKLLPARHMVTDGKVLIIKGERELLAVDVDSFEPIWTTRTRLDEVNLAAREDPDQWPLWVSGSSVEPQDPLDGDPAVHRLFYDTVGGSVAIAFDMALTIQWPEEPPATIAKLHRLPNRGGRLRGLSGFTGAHPNRVMAYSLADGSLVWKSDTAGAGALRAAGSGPGAVEFLAVPIPVNGCLLAPCRVSSDLYAAILDPRTGKVVRHIYLCGTGGGPFDSLYALEPCAADGVVFFPTGRGILIALEAADWSVRWAVRYTGPDEPSPERGWLPTPVIAAADVVLLAPRDSDHLLCLDRGSGELLWRVGREGFTYLLGATDTHVWMAGQEVQLIEIETGRRLWRKACGEPTGRGAVAGDCLYLPTADGLLAMNALTGEPIPIEQPAQVPPLGNLLAWDGSLYSVSIPVVRKFPDLARGYVNAVARHSADPADASRAIRLAWLELLKNQPAKALAALAGVPDTLTEHDQRQHAQVIHLRVRSMLELASSGEVPSDAALKLLQDARTAAKSPEDAIHSALALGDHHHREGHPLKACLQYLALALSAEGDRIIATDPGFEQRARSLAMRRIADTKTELGEADSQALEARIHHWLDEAVGQQERAGVGWVAESGGLGDSASYAALILGIWAAEELRFEQAHGFFSQVLRRGKSPELLAEATARLAALCLGPEELHLPVSAAELLDRLDREFAAIRLPAGILEPKAAVPGSGEPAGTGKRIPASMLAAKLRARIDQQTLARHRAAMEPIPLNRLGEPTVQNYPGARPLSIRGRRSEPFTDLLMTLVDEKRVETCRADDGQILWSAELRLLGEPALDTRLQASAWPQELGRSTADRYVRPAHGVVDGQILVVNSEYGLHAIGLPTGRRLWARPFDPPYLQGQEPSGSDAWIWVHQGYLVSVGARGHLEVSPASDGERILWRRSMPERRWYATRARGQYLAAVDADLEQVDIFRLADGRYLGQGRFAQEPDRQKKVNIALYDEVICGPASNREVVALELASPGAETWRVSTSSTLGQIFKPTPDLVAVADRSGRVLVIDPKTGKTQMAAAVYACEEGVTDGALIDGVLYVCGYQKRANRYDDQLWALAAVNWPDGSLRWQKEGINARPYLPAAVVRASANAIPVAVFKPAGRRRGKRNGGTIELTLLDKETGAVIGETVSAVLSGEAGAHAILDVQVWPGQVIVVAGSSHVRFDSRNLDEPGSNSSPAGDDRANAARADR